jgi:hypothetical protein
VVEPINLGYVPRDWQAEVHLNLKRFSVLVCHRRAGKTVLAVMQLIHKALFIRRDSGRFAYIAPYTRQAKAIAWPYIKRYGLMIPDCRINESELYIQFRNGSQIRIYGADNPDSLRGIYLDGVVLDEVAQLRPETWQDVLRPALTDRQGWALFIGTPAGQNLFSTLYYRARLDPEWYAKLWTIRDTDALPADEVKRVEKDLRPNVFAREYLCDFSAAAANQLLSANEVDQAMRRNYREPDFSFAPKVFGVDVARQGDDSTVIMRRQGIYAGWAPIVMDGATSMQVADRLAYEIAEWRPDAVFIDGSGGYGAGVIDRLRTMRHRVVEVQFGGSPGNPRYANKRAEMWDLMAEWVRSHGQLAREARLIEDLCAPTYEHDGKDRLELESKDSMRERGLPSPDYGDALALTFAAPIQPAVMREREIQARTSSRGAPQQAFDPLASVRNLVPKVR